MITSLTGQNILRFDEGKISEADESLAVESPFTISLVHTSSSGESRTSAIAMRTPGHDEELALGYLYTEGLISDIASVKEIRRPNDSAIDVILKEGHGPIVVASQRQSYQSSSCGVCGKDSLDQMEAGVWPEIGQSLKVSSKLLITLPDKLREQQGVFQKTGGLHASALVNAGGDLLVVREDVGRHNAVDKIVGHALLQKMFPLNEHLLLLSGRISYELVQKARRAGMQLIAAVGAPSSLAVETADRAGITLVGFLRGNRFNVYGGAERVSGIPL